MNKTTTGPAIAIARTDQELRTELAEQFEALKIHGASYDEGKTWQAKTLAAVISILMRDGSRNMNPLLQQLGIRKQMLYVDSRGPLLFPEHGAFNAPLTAIQMGPDGVKVVPHCSVMPDAPWIRRNVAFSDWWGGDVLQTSRGQRITRHRLVNLVRDKDGGAHYDAENKEADYHDVKVDFDPRIRIHSPAGPGPLQGVHLATIRQIAWELEQTLAPVVGGHLIAAQQA